MAAKAAKAHDRRKRRRPSRTAPGEQADLTALQRERVRELLSRSDRRIALLLIEEGLFPEPKDCKTDEAYALFVESCRRTVNNHRHAIRDDWKALSAPTLGDVVATQEYVARLRSRIEDLDDLLESRLTKPTARINALAEIRQIETLIAKVSGVDIEWKRFGKVEDPGDENQTKLPFVGVLVNMDNVPPEIREEIEREQRRRGDNRRSSRNSSRTDPKVQVQRRSAGSRTLR